MKQNSCISDRAHRRKYGPFWDGTKPSLVVTDISGQAIGPIFRVQAVQEMYPTFFFKCLTLADGTL